MSRAFASKVELIGSSGEHVRFIPGTLASGMVASGAATVANQNGRVKSIRLVEVASTHAERIGEPSPPTLGGVKFVRKARLDTPSVVWEHHPRATYPEPE